MLQILPECGAEGRILQRELDSGNEEPQFVAGIVPVALDFVREHRGLLHQLPQRIGQLNFSVLSGLCLAQDGENLRRQHITTDDRQIGGRIRRGRLFYEIVHTMQTPPMRRAEMMP